MKKGKLYIVATPIGNLQDLSIRAIETLKNSDIIACENTLNSKKLLDNYSISAKLIPYNDHSNQKQRENIIASLSKGQDVALITDKGTPLISDPGYKLTREIAKQGFSIYAIPGACSLINALVSSALPTDSFFFAGFLDSKETSFQKLSEIKSTIVIFESPKRVLKTLESIKSIFGENVDICVSREMTKMFEEHVRGKTQEVLETFKAKDKIKGEFVISIDNNKELKKSIKILDEKITKLLSFNVPLKEIANILSDDNFNKKDIYNYALSIKNQN